MLARLFYPVANPQFNYQFCKGFYARCRRQSEWPGQSVVGIAADTLDEASFGAHPFLDYLDSFRYPLGNFRCIDVLRDCGFHRIGGLRLGC